ncbi:hypothetical protein P872_09280 [Rhodonellum psychrophilum GCM71 = DSM 17998]|uniref:Polysaccharide (De)acetylase n=2 Tax=Rhodonellum TaxID=336827 RepID=U5C047_9BACT|nr:MULTISPECIES: hypothetical protein [Rhodonellum]ERM81537.1 hypothetical protein P872_09280 [Rhodonellum psychrophilum GCM71 = DSM 17998]SDZ40565.1 hypothetical protein SAMN05444412_11341 [Rhodonellum ikkaensis]
MGLKNTLTNYFKNIPGWKSNRKLLAFAVDDYGNIRLSSVEAKDQLKAKGVSLKGRFNNFDSLDTREDYEMLFAVLQSVKDKDGKSAVFTTYALPANVDFSKTLSEDKFVHENLDLTYSRLEEVNPTIWKGTFKLLQEGISLRLIKPQFHGREHLNVMAFNRLLKDKNPDLMDNLALKSLAGIPNHEALPKVRFNEAFSFWNKSDIDNHKAIIKDGLDCFETVYGYKSATFTPPAMLLHPELYSYLESLGIKAIDRPRSHWVHLGEGNYLIEKNKLGVQKDQNHVTVVRNCMFEPNSRNIDWVDFTFEQIKAAFFWGKPAIVSSHRVNFCGLIDPSNRQKGLSALKALLIKVVKAYPDVEFVGMDELVDIINNGK